MKKNFKFMSLVLCVFMAGSFSACNETNNTENPSSEIDDTSVTSSIKETETSENSNNSKTDDTEDESVSDEITTVSEEPKETITGHLLVIDDDVNVRQDSSTDSDILETVSRSTIFSYYHEDDGWYKISYDDNVAFISSDFVQVIDEDLYNSLETEENYDDLYGTVSENANLRDLPDTEVGQVIQNVTSVQVFKILEKTKNDWYKVYFEDSETSGYILSELVSTLSKEEYENITKKPEKLDDYEDTIELISSYTTDYSFSNPNRKFNLERACDAINHMVIEPGAKFDWCRDMGPCGKDEGYLLSNVIMNGGYVQDYGGGICQLSSTLCASVLTCEDGKFSLIERYKHGIPQSYIPRDLDATVSYPDCNFSFRNDNSFPVMIETVYTDDMNLTVNLYKVEL